MAITRVNGVATHSASSASSYAASALSVTAGNLLVVIVRNTNDGGTISSITDTAGNTFVEAVAGGQASVNGGKVWLWYAENVTGNASDVVTVNFSASETNCSVVVQQFSGVATTTSLRATSAKQGTGGSASVTSNSFTPTAGDLLVSGLDDEPAGAATGYTQPTGYTSNETRTLFPAGASAYNLSATGGAQTDTWSATGGSGHNLAMITAVFKPSGVNRDITAGGPQTTFTLAGPLQKDRMILGAPQVATFTPAGNLQADRTLTNAGAIAALFTLAGGPQPPNREINPEAVQNVAAFSSHAVLTRTAPDVVYVWGVPVSDVRYGGLRDVPDLAFFGVKVGNLPPVPVHGAVNLVINSNARSMAAFDTTPIAGPVSFVNEGTKAIAGTLLWRFIPSGSGAAVAVRNLTGVARMVWTPAGALQQTTGGVPDNGTTPWSMPADGNWVNVRNFGATGNGVTDDTQAFINACNTRKKVFVPAANPGQYYRITAGVLFYNDIYGDGTMPQIRMTNLTGGINGGEETYSMLSFLNQRPIAPGVIVNGLWLFGGWDGGGAGEWAHNIAVKNSSNLTVKYCRLQNPYGDGVWVGGYSGTGCFNIVVRNNDILAPHRCNVSSNFVDGFYIRDNYLYKPGTYVSAVDIETDNIGTQANHNVFIEGNEWNVQQQEWNTGGLNFTTWPNDNNVGPATFQASALRNNFGRWTNTLTPYYPPANPLQGGGLISSPYGFGPIYIYNDPTKNGAFIVDATPRWT